MAKKVFILGAGASKSAGAPLLSEFIDAADDLRKTDGSVSRDDFNLFFEAYAERLPILHAKTRQNLDDIETVFSLVEMARLVKRFPGTAPLEIEQLARAIRTVLAETIDKLCRFQVAGREVAVPPVYGSFVQRLVQHLKVADEVAFLTFNYDIALDVALTKYKVQFDYGLQPGSAGGVPLLKLHGSLNWRGCRSCPEVAVTPMS